MLPLKWSKTDNVRWRVPLPGPGNSSPIVWGDRVFVSQAVEKENRRTLMCFNRTDGKLLWQHTKNAYGGVAQIPTPIVQGDRVFISTGYGGGSASL